MRAIIVAVAALLFSSSEAAAQEYLFSDCTGTLAGAAHAPAQPPAAEPDRALWARAMGVASACAARQGDFKRAEALYMSALAVDPASLAAVAASIGRAAAQQHGDPTMALRIFEASVARAREADPGDSLIRTLRGASIEWTAARLLLDRRAEAQDEIDSRMRYPAGVLQIQTDRRFAAVWESEEAVNGRIDEQLHAAANWDRDMRVVTGPGFANGVAYWALMAGRPDLARNALLGKGRWTLVAPGADPFAYAGPRDYEHEYAWVRTLIALGELGDWTKSVGPRELMRDAYTPRAVKLLAIALVRADRPADTLALLDRSAPYLAPIDAREIPLLRECAMTRAGRPAGRSAPPPLADIHWTLDALLCAGREDAAAALIVENLADPDLRAQALQHLQRYAQPRLLGSFDAELRRRRETVLKRPEVMAAIEREGRLLTLAIQEPE